MASAIEAYGKPLTFDGIEIPLIELIGWNIAEIFSLEHITGTPRQIGDLQFIEPRNATGDVAALFQSNRPDMVELVHSRRLKPWVKPKDSRVAAAIKEASTAYPGIFVFEVAEVNEEVGQINISSLVDLAKYPLPVSVEILKLRWQQAAKIYRTGLAGVVTPFRHIRQK